MMYKIYSVHMNTDRRATLGLRRSGKPKSVIFACDVSDRWSIDWKPMLPIVMKSLKSLEPIGVRKRADYAISTTAYDDNGKSWMICWQRIAGRRVRYIIPTEAEVTAHSETSAAP